MARDFWGYGRDKPRVEWRGGARVAVSVVVKFEEGAELAISDGDDRNEGQLDRQQGRADDQPPLME